MDVMCTPVGSNYVTHLLTLWFRGAICTLYPTINSIVGLTACEFTRRISVFLANSDVAFDGHRPDYLKI